MADAVVHHLHVEMLLVTSFQVLLCGVRVVQANRAERPLLALQSGLAKSGQLLVVLDGCLLADSGFPLGVCRFEVGARWLSKKSVGCFSLQVLP